MRWLSMILSTVMFAVGTLSLGLTLYLWFGEWPEQAKGTVDHLRSVAENTGRDPEPLLPSPRSGAGTLL